MNKVKAYTVMEMIVVMIISSIVITMSYAVFTRVVLLNHKVGDIYRKNYNVILFNRLMTVDFVNSEQVLKDAYGFSCVYKDHTVFYEINDFLSRKQSIVTDTLFSLTNTEIEYEYIDKDKKIIKSIIVSGKADQQPLKLIYHKLYGSDLLMKLDEQGN
ncbi:MAG: prepilin-type N-terminal cleavage/methylation domain-containing protein [Cytophagaceae bacterium]|nr:prepilin-type N-terminal cleavage/methylation domain-containing protein [Cytophagaceae bacterium]